MLVLTNIRFMKGTIGEAPIKEMLESDCARSSGAVHNVFLIDVYLDLENPGGSGFWVGENGRVAGETKRVSLQASGSRGRRVLTQKEGFK